MKHLNRFALLGCMTASVLLGACSSTPVAAPPATPTATPTVQAPPVAVVAPKAAEPAPVVKNTLPPYLDPANPLSSQRSVYFDFDQYQVKPEGNKVLEMHGKYLAAHPEVSIKIEGNTDEQGGAEYNLALGQKRAQSVVQVLKVYGVNDKQMEAVSFGKEKPKALGHDEESHAQNRRADLDYPSK